MQNKIQSFFRSELIKFHTLLLILFLAVSASFGAISPIMAANDEKFQLESTASSADDWYFNQGNGSYVPGSTTTIQNTGTGVNWNANFRRNTPTDLTSGNKISFDFYVDQKGSKTYLESQQIIPTISA